MSNPGEAKRHHTVPKSYLLNFAENGKLFQCDLKTGKIISTNVINASVISNFHTIGHDTKEDRTMVEKLYSDEIESKIPEMVLNLNGEDYLKYREHYINLYTNLKHRSTFLRQGYDETFGKVIKDHHAKIISDVLQNKNQIIDSLEVDSSEKERLKKVLARADEYTFKTQEPRNPGVALSIIAWEAEFQQLKSNCLDLLEFSGDLLTSDNPAGCPGFLPLTPQKAILIHNHGQSTHSNFYAGDETTYNHIIKNTSTRFLFAKNREILEKYL